MKCPGCGAQVSTRTSERVLACRYCETEIRNPDPVAPPPDPPQRAPPGPDREPRPGTGEDLAEAPDWTGDVEWPSFQKSVEQATGIDVSGDGAPKKSGCSVLLAILTGLATTAVVFG